MARSSSGRGDQDSRRDRDRRSSKPGRRFDDRDRHYDGERYDADRTRDRGRRQDDERRQDWNRAHSRDRTYNPRDDRRERDRFRDQRDEYRPRDPPRNQDRPRQGDTWAPRDAKRLRDEDESPARDGRNRHRNDRYGDAGHGRNKRRRGSYASGGKDSRPSTSDAAAVDTEQPLDDAERIKQERRAKFQNWKQTALAKSSDNAGNAASPPTQAESDAIPADADDSDDPPGSKSWTKFDPNAIKARVLAKMDKNKQVTLDGHGALRTGVSANMAPPPLPLSKDNSRAQDVSRASSLRSGAATVRKSGDVKIGGIGLGKLADGKHGDQDPETVNSATLDEDQEVTRESRKLPDFIPLEPGAPMTSADDDGRDLRDDEAEAEVARLVMRKRAGRSRALLKTSTANPVHDSMDVDQDPAEDPLDAFMKTLHMQRPSRPKRVGRSSIKAGPAATRLFEDEPVLDAVADDPGNLLALAKKKKRVLPPVDHNKANYEEFRKAFYTEPAEIASMSEDDINRLRYDLDAITVRGRDVPTPITKWPHSGLGAPILEVLRTQKFHKPTPIQAQALPAIMSGRDIIGIAKTGSGKTLAFLLPMFRHIKDQRPLANMEGPIGLILAPTRELVTQIYNECKPYMKALGIRAMAAVGGDPITNQIADLKRGAELIVATPGRMIDLLCANQGRVTNLRRVTYVVLDEADRMFDQGFEPQISLMMDNIRPNRQTVFFSATFPPKMEKMAKKSLQTPVEIQAGARSIVPPEIKQVIEVIAQKDKFKRLLKMLGDLFEEDQEARVLVFVERQEAADVVFKGLYDAQYQCVSVHGGREQVDRDQAMQDFKMGYVPILIATSVAARGLDVKQLKLVVNFDSPNHGEDYVHRAGRTGRAGNTGTAVTFVTPEQEQFAPMLRRALKDSKQPIPDDLQKLAEAFKEKYKSGEVKYSGMGFGGKGIERFDAARAVDRAREKRQYGPEDETAEEQAKEEEKKQEASKKADDLVAKAIGGVRETQATPAAAASPVVALPPSLDERLNDFAKVKKHEHPGKSKSNKAVDPMELVLARTNKINARIGASNRTGRVGGPVDNHGPDAGAYHSTIEVNDFPQKARWAVTNRSNVAKILDATGTSITNKGIYYPEGKEPGPNDDPKLYCLVEGDTEHAVAEAVQALIAHLRAGILQAQEAEARAPPSGRYSIV